MGLCWDRYKSGKTLKELEGPYKLSLREISSITGVDHTALRRREGKNTREGVLDHLQKIGYLTYLEGKPVDEFTGKEGRAQTYIYIHLERIWKDNEAFSKENRLPSNRLVAVSSFHIVDQNNTTVDDNNSDVDQNNTTVVENNHTVVNASSNSAQDNKTNKTGKTERRADTPASQNPKEPTHTPIATQKEEEKPHQVTDGSKKVFTPEELTTEERMLHTWYHDDPCPSLKRRGKPGQVTSKQREQYQALLPDVKTQHAFHKLVEYTEKYIQASPLQDKAIFLGNLVDQCADWKRTYKAPSPEKPKPKEENPWPANTREHAEWERDYNDPRLTRTMREGRERERRYQHIWAKEKQAQAAKQNTPQAEEPARATTPPPVRRHCPYPPNSRKAREWRERMQAQDAQAQVTETTSETSNIA
jgi:hypothetical protein